MISYGRRRRDTTSARRKREATREDMLLVQSIHISDKFGFPLPGTRNSSESETVFIQSEAYGSCMNVAYIAVSGELFFKTISGLKNLVNLNSFCGPLNSLGNLKKKCFLV